MKNKKIGIVGWKTGDNSFGITMPYYEYLAAFGDVVIIAPGQYIPVDLLVLPGGSDVDVTRYARRPRLFTSNPNVILEYFDKYILPLYIERDTPIFGICRGMQTLNVQFGGGLIQHLRYHPYSLKGREEKVHDLELLYKPLIDIFELKKGDKKKSSNKANSLHHQSIDPKRLGEGIEIIMKAEDDVVEGIRHIEKPIYAVQYHPEETLCSIANYMIHELLSIEPKVK